MAFGQKIPYLNLLLVGFYRVESFTAVRSVEIDKPRPALALRISPQILLNRNQYSA
jgi:hypothetical protein